MCAIVDIYSENNIEIKNFLHSFFNQEIEINDNQRCEIIYKNPLYCADIISSSIDNLDKFKISMWISLDKHLFINITKINADKIIRYLFERYPY